MMISSPSPGSFDEADSVVSQHADVDGYYRLILLSAQNGYFYDQKIDDGKVVC
jgi:hypothetical protein